MGKYDQTYAFGIITTFKKLKNKPDLTTFKKLMDKQFEKLKNLLLNGYDIVIPTPTTEQVRKYKNKFCNNNKQVIYHNLGTGIANLKFKYLLCIQNKIDQLKKHMKYNKIIEIKCYNHNQNNTHKTIDSNDESDNDSDLDNRSNKKMIVKKKNYHQYNQKNQQKRKQPKEKCSCNCHKKREIDDGNNHCSICLHKILVKIENAIRKKYPQIEEID